MLFPLEELMFVRYVRLTLLVKPKKMKLHIY